MYSVPVVTVKKVAQSNPISFFRMLE